MDKRVVKQRTAAVRRRMQAKNIDCMLLTDCENVSYMTGFTGDDSWVLVSRGVTLLTDSRYTEQAEQECAGCRIVERSGPIVAAIAGIINRSRSVKTVGVEETCSIGTLRHLRKQLKPRIKPVDGVVETVRRAKNAAEAKSIRRAATVAWQALAETLPEARVGMSEGELAGMLDFRIRQLGYTNSFETIVAFGPNGSRNHHQPGRRKLRRRDTILIDFGARADGYCSDMTRCFAVGQPSRFFSKVYDTVVASQQAAIDVVRAGVELRQVDAAARQVIADQKLAVYGHGTGHGLGLQVHEMPYMSELSTGKLQVGDVITIEPGIYYPGRFGVRHEDDLLVTENGCKNLSEDRRFGFSQPGLPVLEVS